MTLRRLDVFSFLKQRNRWVLQNSDFFDSDSSKTEKKSKAVTSDRLFLAGIYPILSFEALFFPY